MHVVRRAVERIDDPPQPGAGMARLAAIDLLLTAITGSVFYWLAFVA